VVVVGVTMRVMRGVLLVLCLCGDVGSSGDAGSRRGGATVVLRGLAMGAGAVLGSAWNTTAIRRESIIGGRGEGVVFVFLALDLLVLAFGLLAFGFTLALTLALVLVMLAFSFALLLLFIVPLDDVSEDAKTDVADLAQDLLEIRIALDEGHLVIGEVAPEELLAELGQIAGLDGGICEERGATLHAVVGCCGDGKVGIEGDDDRGDGEDEDEEAGEVVGQTRHGDITGCKDGQRRMSKYMITRKEKEEVDVSV
jgi:hypothetical protein